ncbi:MAG: hypothetical protein WB473_17680 [Pedococcus sp.]
MWFLVTVAVLVAVVVAIGLHDLRRKPDPTLAYDAARSALPPSEHVNGSSGWEGVTRGADPGRGLGL